ncbi:hypothetical protein CRENBAI_009343 [Crenichthys baileyi]|uniref:Uncharacterized protein n=1 Tax=Crenichthys baileyi TaxID=28760 RepID=A0AAV9SDE9_9TELE
MDGRAVLRGHSLAPWPPPWSLCRYEWWAPVWWPMAPEDVLGWPWTLGAMLGTLHLDLPEVSSPSGKVWVPTLTCAVEAGGVATVGSLVPYILPDTFLSCGLLLLCFTEDLPLWQDMAALR